MAISLNDIVKKATAGTDTSGSSGVRVVSGESAKTKSGSESLAVWLNRIYRTTVV